MRKAIIIYQSKKGTTKQLSNEIADFVKYNEINTRVTSIEDFDETDLSTYDYIFLGCWTKGLLFLAQHPDAQWQNSVKSLRLPDHANIALFTTYKIATGSMFMKMKACLPENHREGVLTIRSRSSQLLEDTRAEIEDFIA